MKGQKISFVATSRPPADTTQKKDLLQDEKIQNKVELQETEVELEWINTKDKQHSSSRS